jgi:glycosyltransferase involved in cell wall biosynthesis
MPGLYATVAASGGTVLLTTRNESFGFAALEAMASGCPVVASSVGGIPEVIEDGTTGLLYPLGDVPSATSHVTTLLGNGELRARLGRRAMERARVHFAPDRCLGQLAAALATICDQG